MTREAWLEAAILALWPIFPQPPPDEEHSEVYGVPLRPLIKVSMGWPKGGRGKHSRGQCWDHAASSDNETRHIFLAPTEEPEAVTILGILAHEMVHALVGSKEKHKGRFIKVAKFIGLEPKWTECHLSLGLEERLREVAKILGAFPHVSLKPIEQKKQSARMLKYECGHGKIVRAAATDPLNAVCQGCGTRFEAKG